jgi:signal transduction histidine kinase
MSLFDLYLDEREVMISLVQNMVDSASATIPCPHCGRPVDPQARYCAHCGVDLAVAAVIAEQAMTMLPEGVPLAPEVLVPRIGEYMLENKIIQASDLQAALDFQEQRQIQGKPILLGQALLELGRIDQSMLDKVITMRILQLQNALNEMNKALEKRVQERTLDLQHALDRLGELNQLKSNFIANISHELRTPLTHIKGYLDILSDDGLGELTPQQHKALDVIQRSEERLERLIEDLIQFSLASRGEISLNLATVDFKKTVLATAEQFIPKAQAAEVELHIHIEDTLPCVRVDEEKLKWILGHLLDNGLKFTPVGGYCRLDAVLEHNRVQVTVSDNGIGIPDEQLHEIFEPFHQLDGSTKRHYSGTGLGLAMVKRILEAHGSQIVVKSEIGHGSQFQFTLPVDRSVELANGEEKK